MKVLQLIGFIALFSLFQACKKSDGGGTVSIASKTEINVLYGTDAKQKMDIYLPADRNPATTKSMILIHGGAWVAGDKSDFDATVDSLKKVLPDYAFFNINYRLSAMGGINPFPTQEIDVRTAYNHIYANRAQYQVSDKFILAGASAGGHLAMLIGYKDDMPIKPKAIVSFFGPSDLIDMYNNPVGNNNAIRVGLASAVGATPTTNAAIYNTSSPINYITPNAPPTILLHGGLDPLVAPSQSTKVRDALTARSIANEYVFYPNGGHGDWDNATFRDSYSRIATFLATNVK